MSSNEYWYAVKLHFLKPNSTVTKDSHCHLCVSCSPDGLSTGLGGEPRLDNTVWRRWYVRGALPPFFEIILQNRKITWNWYNVFSIYPLYHNQIIIKFSKLMSCEECTVSKWQTFVDQIMCGRHKMSPLHYVHLLTS